MCLYPRSCRSFCSFWNFMYVFNNIVLVEGTHFKILAPRRRIREPKRFSQLLGCCTSVVAIIVSVSLWILWSLIVACFHCPGLFFRFTRPDLRSPLEILWAVLWISVNFAFVCRFKFGFFSLHIPHGLKELPFCGFCMMQEMIAKPNHGGRSRCNLWKISLHMAERATVEEFVIQSRSESYVYIYICNLVICVSHPGVKETKCSSCLVGKVTSTSWWWICSVLPWRTCSTFVGEGTPLLSCLTLYGPCWGGSWVKVGTKKTIDRYMIYDSIRYDSIVQLTMTSSLTLSLKLLFALLARACLSSQSLTLIHPCLVRQLSRLDVWRATYVITQLLTMTPSHSMTMDRTMCVCVCVLTFLPSSQNSTWLLTFETKTWSAGIHYHACFPRLFKQV